MHKRAVVFAVLTWSYLAALPWASIAWAIQESGTSTTRPAGKAGIRWTLPKESHRPHGEVYRLGPGRLTASGPLKDVAFSPDGRFFVMASNSPSVSPCWQMHLFQTQRWQPVRYLRAPNRTLTHQIKACCFTPDSKRVVALLHSPPSTASLLIWNVAGNAPGRVITDKAVLGTRMSITPDGQTVIVLDRRHRRLVAWSVETGKRLWRYRAKGKGLLGMQFDVCPLGTAVAIGQAKTGVVLISPVNGKVIRRIENKKSTYYAVAFSPDGSTLYTTDFQAKELAAWDVRTGKQRWSSQTELHPLMFCVTADGALLGVQQQSPIGYQGRLSVHRTTDGHRLRVVRDVPTRYVDQPKAAPCDQVIAVVPWGSGLPRFVDLATGRQVLNPISMDCPQSIVHRMSISPDGRHLVTGVLRSWPVRIRDLKTGRAKVVLKDCPPNVLPETAFSPDGKLLAVGHGDWANATKKSFKGVTLWNPRTGKLVHKITLPDSGRAIAFHPDGSQLAAAGLRQSAGISLIDVATGKRTGGFRPPRGGSGPRFWLNYHPSGDRLVMGDVWNMTSVMAMPKGRARSLNTCSRYLWDGGYSPNGRHLLVAAGAYAETWDADGKALLARVCHNHGSHATAIAFSPDGNLAAVSHLCGHITIISVAEGKIVLTMGSYNGSALLQVVWTPDGSRIISAGTDHTIRYWNPWKCIKETAGPAPSVDELWETMADKDAVKAWRAAMLLSTLGQEAVDLLADQLKPAGKRAANIDQLIIQLGDDQFNRREEAFAKLFEVVDQAAPALRKALVATKDVEVRIRIQTLLKKAGSNPRPRALAVLEWIASPAAETLLEKLATGATGTRLTVDAAAAARRLKRRKQLAAD